MRDDDLALWTNSNKWIMAIPHVKFTSVAGSAVSAKLFTIAPMTLANLSSRPKHYIHRAGCVVYLLSIIALAYRDLENSIGARYFSLVFGLLGLMMVFATSIYTVKVSPQNDFGSFTTIK
jgi:hypothetical protein